MWPPWGDFLSLRRRTGESFPGELQGQSCSKMEVIIMTRQHLQCDLRQLNFHFHNDYNLSFSFLINLQIIFSISYNSKKMFIIVFPGNILLLLFPQPTVQNYNIKFSILQENETQQSFIIRKLEPFKYMQINLPILIFQVKDCQLT